MYQYVLNQLTITRAFSFSFLMVEKILDKKHILVVGWDKQIIKDICYNLYHVLLPELDSLPYPAAKRKHINDTLKNDKILLLHKVKNLDEVTHAASSYLEGTSKIDLMIIVCDNKLSSYYTLSVENFFSSFSTFCLNLKQKTIACAYTRSDWSKWLFEKHWVKTYKVGLNTDERAQFCKEIRFMLETNENNDNKERIGTNELE